MQEHKKRRKIKKNDKRKNASDNDSSFVTPKKRVLNDEIFNSSDTLPLAFTRGRTI